MVKKDLFMYHNEIIAENVMLIPCMEVVFAAQDENNKSFKTTVYLHG